MNPLQGYFDAAVRLHLHLGLVGRHGEETKYCAAHSGPLVQGEMVRDDYSVKHAFDLRVNERRTHNEQRSMLVCIGEAAEDRKRVEFGVLRPSLIRLRRLDECECWGWGAGGPFLESVSPALVQISPGFHVDVGLPNIIRKDRELAFVIPERRTHYVVQRGASVGNNIADYRGDVIAIELPGIAPNDDILAIAMGFNLALNEVRLILLSEPVEGAFKFGSMFLCPPQLDPPRPVHATP